MRKDKADIVCDSEGLRVAQEEKTPGGGIDSIDGITNKLAELDVKKGLEVKV